MSLKGKQIIHFNTIAPENNNAEWCPKHMCINAPGYRASRAMADNPEDYVSLSEFSKEQGSSSIIVAEAVKIAGVAPKNPAAKGVKMYDYDSLLCAVDAAHLPYSWLSKSQIAGELHVSDEKLSEIISRIPEAKGFECGSVVFYNPELLPRFSGMGHQIAKENIMAREALNKKHKREPRPPMPRKEREYEWPPNPSQLTALKTEGYVSAEECANYMGISVKVFSNLLSESGMKADKFVQGLGRFFKLESLGPLIEYTAGYSIDGAAKELGISCTTLKRRIDNGNVKMSKLNGRHYIAKEELERYRGEQHEHISD